LITPLWRLKNFQSQQGWVTEKIWLALFVAIAKNLVTNVAAIDTFQSPKKEACHMFLQNPCQRFSKKMTWPLFLAIEFFSIAFPCGD
jgi:hypothetical protein